MKKMNSVKENIEENTDFKIKSPKLIVQKLQYLERDRRVLSAQTRPKKNNKPAFITAILEVNPNNNKLYIDAAPNYYLNKLVTQCHVTDFYTDANGVKVHFKGEGIHLVQYNKKLALEMPIPDELKWQERRRTYRIRLPEFHQSFVALKFNENFYQKLADTQKEAVKEALKNDIADGLIQFKLLDISLGGCSFLNENKMLGDIFNNSLYPEKDKEGVEKAGHKNESLALDHACLVLHDKAGSPLNLNLTVRNAVTLKETKSVFQQRLGCQFDTVNMRNEIVIQNYMREVERRLAKLFPKPFR